MPKLVPTAPTDRNVAPAGGVVLRGVMVDLNSDVGEAFVTDCARNIEGLLSDDDIKHKWALSDESWAGLANNAPLLAAVRAERDRRINSGEAARAAAQRHFANAPNILNHILTDEQVAPRHRIEAARELRQAAEVGPDAATGSTEKFVICINLGADEKLVYEKQTTPHEAVPSDDGEPS